MKTLQNYIEYGLILLTSSLIGLLPWRWAQTFGRGLGIFCFHCVPIRKNVALENIQHTFPEKSADEVYRIARGTYIHFGQTIVEFLQLSKRSARFLLQQVHFEPPDFLAQAQQTHYGAICLTGHFGNWELLGAAITDSGIPLSGIAKEQRNPFVDRLIANARAKRGIETFPMGIALRGILKALKEKKFVALLGDQDAHREGVFVQFLGRPSSTARGPAAFALKTGAPLFFGADVRESNGKHTIYLQEIEHSDLSGVSEDNIRILTQRHAGVLEKFVRQWPDHWFWMHKRWKTKPDDMPV